MMPKFAWYVSVVLKKNILKNPQYIFSFSKKNVGLHMTKIEFFSSKNTLQLNLAQGFGRRICE